MGTGHSRSLTGGHSALNEKFMREHLSAVFDVDYLAPVSVEAMWPVPGVVTSGLSMYNSLVIVAMPVKSALRSARAGCLLVFFLLDTGSPRTFICTTALLELGFSKKMIKDPVNQHALPVRINGFNLTVSNSEADEQLQRMAGINVLGADFLKAAAVAVAISYAAINREERQDVLFPMSKPAPLNAAPCALSPPSPEFLD